MKIWVDADACPKVIKEIIYRVTERTGIDTVLVANQWFRFPPIASLSFIQVEQGPDVADDMIAEKCAEGDVVVTADIPLAARVVEKKAHAIDPRGKLHTAENIRQTLGMRDFMDSLRGSGIETGGPPALSQRERQDFANCLDQIIAKAKK